MNLYLDHNVYISCLKDGKLKKALIQKRDINHIIILYSPAHMEEIYKVSSNDRSIHNKEMVELIELIEEISQCYEVFPNN